MKRNTIRPFVQIGIFILFFIVPLLDIFRMDLLQLRFFVFGKSFAYNEGYILLICVFLMVFTFLAISRWFGRQFCGWMCPHNTFSFIVNKTLDSGMIRKSKELRKLIELGLSALIAPVIAYCLISYFFDPITLFKEIIALEWKSWSVVAYITLVCIFFVMIYRLRTSFCRLACPYGMFQMSFADKNSRTGGVKNMVKGPGLVLLILVVSLVSLLAITVNSTVGFSATIGKELQGVPAGEFLTYTYTLKIQNNHDKPMTYHVLYNGIPATWETRAQEKITVEPGSNHTELLLFRIDKPSVNKTHPITMDITSEDGHVIHKKLIILPVEKK